MELFLSQHNIIDLKSFHSDSFVLALQGLKWTRSTADWTRGVSYYIRAISDLIEAKYDISEANIKEIFLILWEIVTNDFKEFCGPSVDVLLKILRLSLNLLKKKKLKNLKLELPWRPLYHAVNYWCFPKWKTPNFNGKKLESLQRLYLNLVRKTRKFFGHKSTKEIVEEFLPKLCIHSNEIFRAQCLFVLFINVESDYDLWLPQVFSIWEWIPNCPYWSFNWVNLLARLSKNNYESLSFNIESKLPFIFTQLIQFSGLALGGSSLAKLNKPSYPSECLVFTPSMVTSRAFTKFAKLIIYSINSSNKTVDYLAKFISQIQSYFHPSNEGLWSSALGLFLESLASIYVKRIKKDSSLTDTNHLQFVNTLFPACQAIIYSKRFYVSKLGINCLLSLSYLLPDTIYQKFIERILFIISSPTAARQIGPALDASASLVPGTIQSRSFAVTLPRLLFDTLPAIDLNDTTKTYGAFKFYYGLLTFVPIFQGSAQGSAGYSGLDAETVEARKMVVNEFSEWAFLFLDKVFEFLYHNEQTKKTNSNVPAEFGRNLLGVMLKRTIRTFWMQLSVSLHSLLMDKLINYIDKNQVLNSKLEFGRICSAAVHAHPSVGIKAMFTLCEALLNPKTQELKATENKTLWIVYLLSKAVRYSGASVLNHRSQLESLLNALRVDFNKSKLVNVSHKLLRNVLKTLTRIYPLDTRSMSPSEWHNESLQTNHWQKWGKNYSDDIHWHLPSEAEINFAKELIQKFGNEALSILDQFWRKKSQPNITDKQIAVYMSTVKNIMHGAGPLLKDKFQDDESEYIKHIRDINEENGFIELKKINTPPLIPSGYLNFEFRIRVCDVVHSLCLYYLKEQSHYIPAINSLAKLVVNVLSIRDIRPGKYKGLRTSFKIFKKYFKDRLSKSPPKYPRTIQVEKEYLKLIHHMENSLFGLPFHKQSKELFSDLIQLYSKYFDPLQGLLDSIVGCFRQYPLSLGYFLPSLIQKLEDRQISEPEIKAVTNIISSKYVINRIVKKWKFLEQFVKSLSLAHVQEKATIQTKLYTLFSKILQTYFSEPISITLPEVNRSLSGVPTDAVQKAIESIHYQNSMNSSAYRRVIIYLCDLLESGAVHWRYQTMALGFLLCLRQRQEPANLEDLSIIILKTVFRILDRAELPLLRTLSIQLIQSILKEVKPFHKKPISVSHRTRSKVVSEPDPNERNWDNFLFYDKLYLGMNGAMTLTPSQKINKNRSAEYPKTIQKLLIEKFNVNFLKKLLQKMEQDHNFSTDEEKDRDDKMKINRLEQFASKMAINIEALIGQFGGLDENKDMINLLLGSYHGWSSSRNTHSTDKLGKGFSALNASFWKAIISLTGVEGIQKSIDLIKDCALSDERGYHCVAAEFLAGSIRAIKNFCYKEYQESVKHLSVLVVIIRDKSYSVDTVLDWASSIRWATSNQDPRRLKWIKDLLFSDPLSSTKTSQSQYQQLTLIDSLLHEFSWRDINFADQLLDYLEAHLDHPYKQVREGIADLLRLIFSVAVEPNAQSDSAQYNLYPKHQNFIKKIITRLEKLQKDDSAERERETLLQWLSFAAHDSKSITPYINELLPCVFQMQTECAENTRNLAKVVITLTSQLPYTTTELAEFTYSSFPQLVKIRNWRDRSLLSPFIQIFVFNHSFLLSAEQLSNIFNIIITLLADPQFEVADTAKKALSSLIRITKPDTISDLIKKFHTLSATKLPSKQSIKPKETDLLARQQGVLGIAALVESQPYSVPDWLPSVIVDLSYHLKDPHPIKKIASDSIKEFWRTHQDEWIFEKEKFTPDQIDAISETSGPSYFA